MEETKTVRRRRRWPWIATGVLVALVVALVMLTPTILVSISYPVLRIDLSPYLGDAAGALVSNKTAAVEYGLARSADGGYILHANGTILEWPFTARVNIVPSFRLFGVDAKGDASIRLDDTPWRLTANFTASSSGEWRMDASIDETDIGEDDPVLGLILSRMQMTAISNLTFSGKVDLLASAERTAAVPVPKWGANLRIKETSIACNSNGKPISVDGLRMNLGAAGIANHVDIKPIFPHADRISAAGMTLTNFFASIRATERAYLVTEAGAGFCGGELKLYSLFLDPERLNAGMTLFVDGIDAGEALGLLNGFRGEASGRLYGKMPLHLKEGSKLRLRNAYLYSVPGETGNLKVYDAKPIVDNLAMGGVPQATCDNLSRALADLEYNVLKVSLVPEEDGGLALTLKIAGNATHDNVTVPVDLAVTFHGDLEQLMNTGFRAVKRK